MVQGKGLLAASGERLNEEETSTVPRNGNKAPREMQIMGQDRTWARPCLLQNDKSQSCWTVCMIYFIFCAP
jgi:hypothetical protein